MPPIINAQGLSKRFGAAPLFQNISFTISEGDRIGLIGPNGSGKSTLLEILRGSVKPDNAESLCCLEDIDGALVGGASLDPQSFAEIVRNAASHTQV